MEALGSPSSFPLPSSFHLSTLPPKPPNLTPSHLPFQLNPPNRPPFPSPPCGNRLLRFRPNSTFPTISPNPTDPSTFPTTAGEAEVEAEEEEGEKFDWFAQWYPVAPVCDLDKRVPHAKTVMGLDVVVWWDRAEGSWRVFEDRCPHRLAPLSEGRIDRWGRLQCVYHGWCFDGSGSCQYIPQAPPDGPPLHTSNKACAAAYPSFEQNKIVWFWASTNPKYKNIVMKKKPPFIPELDDTSYSCLMGMRDVSYGYEVLIENLMDPAHVPYAHYGIMRMPKNLKTPARTDREGGRPLEITVQKFDISGFLAKQENGYGRFIAPCLFYASPDLGSNNESLSSNDTNKELAASPHQRKRRILLVFICIPVSQGRSRLIWVFPRNFAVWIDRLVPRWMFHVGQNLILDSDLYLLHLEERKIAKVGPSNWQKACFVPTKSDALVVAFRKWLRKYSHNQVDWGDKFKAELSPTPPKEQLMDRYWSHSVQCSSCRRALKGLKALEVSLQVVSVALIGIVAAAKQSLLSTVMRSVMVSVALLCFLASKWLSHFIYKNFYFHDYNHALR